MGYKLIYKDDSVLIMTNDEFTEGSIIDIVVNEKSIQRKSTSTHKQEIYILFIVI